MNKRTMTAMLAILLSLSLTCETALARAVVARPDKAVSSSKTEPEPEPEEEQSPAYPYTNSELAARLNGTWKSTFHTLTKPGYHIEDPVAMNFSASERELYLTIESYEARYMRPREWRIENSMLYLSVGAVPWIAEVCLYFPKEGGSTLRGTYTQYEKTFDIEFTKTSDVPVDYAGTPQFVFEGIAYEDWLQKLQHYNSFSENPGPAITYTYRYGELEKALDLTGGIPIQSVLYGMGDVEKMMALLRLVCDNFKHNGAAPVPEGALSAVSLVAGYDPAVGIECRGLSLILTEMLLASGIPAKVVYCIPDLEPNECHVVVHAYSASLGQWIMLDPSYRLVLKNGVGDYVNLPMLRDALVNGETLIPNADAGHNGTPFYMPFYAAYMTKNTFRFSNSADNYPGSFRASGNREHMLVPAGWTVPYAGSRPEIVTTSAAAFWAPPK